MNHINHALFFILLMTYGCRVSTQNDLNYSIHTFYYTWYGTPQIDGSWSHWNHSIVPHGPDPRWLNAGAYEGGDDIGANFYPELGAYSSNNPAIIRKHMEMIKQAGIGVLAISWWGTNDYANETLPIYFDLADEYGLKICFHLEPIFKTVEEFKSLISILVDRFGEHPALYRYKNKPLYYVYDSYKVKAEEWMKILDSQSKTTIRNTALDAHFIGIWTFRTSRDFFLTSGFDGFYTYYASDKYMWASNPENWTEMASFAKEHNLIFSPSIGPGYIDTRIRPWNENVTINRDGGQYYESMFNSALGVSPDFISITSFNEWHEGTQIEAAIPKSIPGYTYENYGLGADPHFYLKKTKELVKTFKN